jgi:hypothetical protein
LERMGRPVGTPPEVAAFGKDMFRRSHRYVAPTLAVATGESLERRSRGLPDQSFEVGGVPGG